MRRYVDADWLAKMSEMPEAKSPWVELIRSAWKWIMRAVLAAIALVALSVLGFWGWQEYNYEAPKRAVTVAAGYDPKTCTDRQWPIIVIVKNNSKRTVNSTSVTITAKFPGRSSELLSWDQRTTGSDMIIKPSRAVIWCYGPQSQPYGRQWAHDPEQIEWGVESFSVVFAD